MVRKDFLKLILSIIICQAAGFIGSLFTSPAVPTWYAALEKPSFNPPNWVFSPVWITLFLLMGISLFLIWKAGLKDKSIKIAILFFAFQLVLNVLWSILFFGLKSPISAFIEIIVLWVAILLTILAFLKISRTAGFLMIPYILWVSFAAVLNFFLWNLN